MLKTEYFVGVNHQMQSLETAIKTATDKRDAFIEKNIEVIARIVSEEIIITPWNNTVHVIPTIKLSYFEK